MKNKIYIIGLVALSLTVLGGIFKIMHWPGAGWLLIFGNGSLSFLFFPLALRSSFLGAGKKRIGLYFAAFIALFADFIGALFKIMHWPGASWMLVFGITFPVIIFLPVYIYFHVKEKEKSLANFMYIMFLLVYLGVMSAFLAVRVQKEVLDDAVRVAYITSNKDYYDLKKISFKELTDFSDIEVNSSELRQYIEEIKNELVQIANDEEVESSVNTSINLWQVQEKDNFSISKSVMIGDSDEGMTGKAFELETKIQSYKDLLLSYSLEDEILKKRIEQLFEMKDYTIQGEEFCWASYHFEYQPLIFVLGTLNSIQDDVKLAETEVLSYLSRN